MTHNDNLNTLDYSKSIRNNDHGYLYITISMLTENKFKTEIFKPYCDEHSDIESLKEILYDYEDSAILFKAINPLFDDIADRKRDIIGSDFLIDTPSIENHKNLCEIVTITPPNCIKWETEAKKFKVITNKIDVKNVECRMFWFATTNGSLTYNISLKIKYNHNINDYYFLSILQKLLFEKEGTSWIYKENIISFTDENNQQSNCTFWDYIKRKFNEHTTSLLEHIHSKKSDKNFTCINNEYWEKLLKFPTVEKIKPESMKAVFVFDDDYFFSILKNRKTRINNYKSIEPNITEKDGTGDYTGLLEKLFHEKEEKIDYHFLSGFFQNIIDFMRQDTSEVGDGTDPIYPKSDNDDTHFLLYANQNSIYEIISKSRSLDFGKEWIGTCPYLFLVHIMTFHNESLVTELEKKCCKQSLT
jgi:hypothetical protein